ncbi:hypothetical protein, partial [Merdimmobilis hominis]|uniref:hypothetical protein n=1 Tax=Merdimmobilis hominis TaxID=2897707 RepID=UPI00195C1F74
MRTTVCGACSGSFYIRKKSQKKMKKGVDKVGGVWYYNIAVTEDRKNKEMRRNIERVAGAKTSKKLRKK